MFRNNETDATVRALESDVRQRVKLHDKQSERDDRELRIDKVGVRGLRFPIQVRDKARAGLSFSRLIARTVMSWSQAIWQLSRRPALPVRPLAAST